MAEWLFRVVKGALIGVGAVLPGISGGVLMVVLGIYRPIMAFLAHPLTDFRRQVLPLVPIGVGFVIGVVALARAVDFMFRTSEVPAVWMFLGLIAGTLPSLYKEAGVQGRSRGAWVAFAAGGLLMGGWMWLFSSTSVAVTPSLLWWIVCGVLWGIGMIVPGLSPSSIFIFLGLYQPMTAGIGSLDLGVIVPLALGLVATVLLLARAMNALLEKAYRSVMHAILGIVIASMIAIVPPGSMRTASDIALNALCFLAGCVVAYGMGWLGKKVKAPEAL